MDNQILSVKPKRGYGFIYCYTSPSGKKYIGKTTTSLKERAKKEAKGYESCVAFWNAIQKYGFENFQVEILEEAPLEFLDEIEVSYIIDLRTTEREYGYNIVRERQEFVASIRHIPVFRYNGETGEFETRYESIAQAERDMSVHCGSIRRVLNQPTHHVKGKLWMTEKVDKAPIVSNNVQSTSISVYMYDRETGNLLSEYCSLRDAARQTGYNRATIRHMVRTGYSQAIRKHIFSNKKVNNYYDSGSTTI